MMTGLGFSRGIMLSTPFSGMIAPLYYRNVDSVTEISGCSLLSLYPL